MTVTRVSPQDAQALLDEGYIYLDVRSVPEFEEGHATGAYNIPLMHRGPGGMAPNPDFLSQVQKAFPPSTKMVIGCRSGGRSLRAAQMLVSTGYEHVVDQRAGFIGGTGPDGQPEPGWKPAGLPVSTESEPERSFEGLK